MPSYLFAGGEDSDFSKVGTCAVITTAGRFRANYARCALQVTTASLTDGWFSPVLAAFSDAWLSNQFYVNWSGGNALGGYAVGFAKSGIRRLTLQTDGGSGVSGKWRLVKSNAAGATTVLATSTNNIPAFSLNKMDIHVNYAVAGSFDLYVGGVNVFSYAGDLTTDGVTSLDQVALGGISSNGGTECDYSEVILSDSDTRGLSLATLPPLAAGNTAAWTGAVTDVNETTLNDATVITSATAAQVEEFTVTPPAVITGTVPIRAVVVAARASKGTTGPQNLQAVVRTGAADFASANLPVTTALARVAANWATNPNTGLAWTAADLTAAGFNIGLKSIA